MAKDVPAGQDNAVQIVVQKLNADCSLMFWKKGHEQQYMFNLDIESHLNKVQVEADKIHQLNNKDKRTLEVLKPASQKYLK